MNLKIVRKVITARLKECTDNVWFNNTKKSTEFPYAIFSCANPKTDESMNNIPIDIDLWDYAKNENALDDLCKTVTDAFDKYLVTSDGCSMIFYFDNVLILSDEDPLISRRSIKLIIREVEL